MRSYLAALALGVGSLACHGSGPETPPAAPERLAPPAHYRLVWSDEFDQPGLPDSSRWLHDTAFNRPGWFNHEQQYYSGPRAENAEVRDGRLVITARKEERRDQPDWSGQPYSSARLITRDKAAWTYGYFEVRAKLPCGKGTWPAAWMLGIGGRWPDDGEIDILEQIGSNPIRLFSTLHTKAGYAANGTGGETQLATACTQFHTYQLLWTADEMRFGIDGVQHFRFANPRTGRDAWPFDAPQYLILNLAIGGDLGGPVDNGIFPVTFEVDYVRVWQAPSAP